MNKIYGLTGKSLSVVMITALLLYFGAVPQDVSWDEGISFSGLAVAAGQGSGHGGGGHSGGHGNGHGQGGSGFSNGNSRSIINYKGRDTHSGSSDTGSGSTKGRGAGSQAVVEKIFDNG